MAYADMDKKRAADRAYYNRNPQRRLKLNRVWKEKRRAWYHEYKKTLKCSVCGESDPVCLQFHHVDGSNKEYILSTAGHEMSEKRFMSEVAKCVVLCANCHMKVHHGNLKIDK